MGCSDDKKTTTDVSKAQAGGGNPPVEQNPETKSSAKELENSPAEPTTLADWIKDKRIYFSLPFIERILWIEFTKEGAMKGMNGENGTYTIDDLGTPITGLPGNETDRVGIHPLGHDEAFGGVPAWKTREQIRISHVNQINTIIETLKQVPEGKGTMFDNTMIMYFPENGETHHGVGSEAPFLIMAGNNCNLNMSGRYVRLPFLGNEGHKTLGNWYTTLLYAPTIGCYSDCDKNLNQEEIKKSEIQRLLNK